MDRLGPSPHHSVCEWKGDASYYQYAPRWPSHQQHRAGPTRTRTPATRSLRDYLAFYAGRVDEAWVGDERATPQPGHFYGGWVTSRIVGPIKGEPGSAGW